MLPTGHSIRCARPRDLDVLCNLEAVAFEPARRSSRAALRRAVTSRFQRVLVLEIDGTVAGMIVLWPHRHTWRVYNLASHPGYRNRGVAGTLLAHAVDLAAASGARTLVLESQADGDLARFYQRRGFVVSRQLPDYYGRGEHAVRMERALPA